MGLVYFAPYLYRGRSPPNPKVKKNKKRKGAGGAKPARRPQNAGIQTISARIYSKMGSHTPKTGGRKQRERRKKGGRTKGHEKKNIANRIFILPFFPPAAKMNFYGDINRVKHFEFEAKTKFAM